jgi:hypothetical protein
VQHDDTAFLFYLTLFARKRFDYPVGRSILSQPAYSHGQTCTSIGVADTLLMCSSPIEQDVGSATWTSLGVTYNATEHQVSFEVARLPTYMFGFYNEDAHVLAITNIVDLDSCVQSTNRNEWWPYRFKSVQAMSLKFSPTRLTSKWARWGTMSPASKFAALETTLFQLNNYESRP